MAREKDFVDELERLKEMAALEDRLYLAQLDLAGEFELIAQAYGDAHPEAMCICKDFIGTESFLVYNARQSSVQTMMFMRGALDKLQSMRFTRLPNSDRPNWFSYPRPAQAFLEAELVKRNLAHTTARGCRRGCGVDTFPSTNA